MTSTSGTGQRDLSASAGGVEDGARRFSLDGFVTSEWEAAADWDVPEGWPPARQQAGSQGVGFFATDSQPLPEWLADLTVPPTPRRVAQAPLPRRRDIRRGTAEIPVVPTAPPQFAAPAADVVGEVLRQREFLPEPSTAPSGPAEERTALPRRRDVHRPDRSAARRASVLAYTGGQSTRTDVKASGLPVAAARLGVVTVLVAVGAGVIGGERLDLLGNGGELTAAEGAAALSLAPLPTDARKLTIWDTGRDQQGLKAAAEKVGERLEAVAEKKRQAKLRAERKAAAARAAREKRERALEAAIANARSNPKAYAKIAVADRGWSASQFQCLNLLWKRESGWNYKAQNPSSGAYGIPQALPGSKMGTVASDWRTNPITQITWGLNYIAARYGTPCGAWAHSENSGWY